MKTRLTLLGGVLAAGLAAAAALTFPQAASAATLQQITNFGANPTNLSMHLYVPDRVATPAPIMVAVHYCTGNGPAYYSGTEWARMADQYGYIVIYPTATRQGACFDVSSPQALRHDGGSDPTAIVNMVKYVQANYETDPAKVFAVGSSSGAMMTNVLLGAYPDVFAAGAAFAGVPFGCFGTTDGSMWNNQCSGGTRIHTAQQWGDMVRNANPGYEGPWPRIQTWHGTNDDTLRYPNFNEQIKQWTNVHGVSETPVARDTPQPNWNRTRYGADAENIVVEAISLQGGSHNALVNGMARYALEFFGIIGAPVAV